MLAFRRFRRLNSRIYHSLSAIAVGVSLSMLASSPSHAQEQKTVENICPSAAELHSGTVETRDATGLIGIRQCWTANPSNGNVRYLTDLYAQWTIEAVPPPKGTPRDYRSENRSPIIRMFVGKNLSIVSSVRIEMKDPDMTFVIPLASFGYQGQVGRGQEWVTDLVSDDQSQPFFRIAPASRATFKVTAKATSDVEVKATGTILNALRSLSSIVSPGGSLITTLNSESLKQTSTALDAALSNIWSETKGEDQSSSRLLNEWYEGSSFLIQLVVPDLFKPKTALTTRWYHLRLSCPKISIFDSRSACDVEGLTHSSEKAGVFSAEFARLADNLNRRITPQQVNNYRLAPGKTIKQHLSDFDWYSRFLRGTDPEGGGEAPQTPVSATPGDQKKADQAGKNKGRERTENDYSSFCYSVTDALYSVGLSALDSRIGLWAIVTGSADFVGITDKFQQNEVCKALLPPSATGTTWYFHPPASPPKK